METSSIELGAFHSEMIVSEVMDMWPQTIPIFLRHKTACVGCLMSRFDTLADVSTNYGIPIEKFLQELTQSTQFPECY